GLFTLLIASTSVYAGFQMETFALLGNGSFMDATPIFSGNIIQGTLATGTFWMRLNMAAGWPADNPGTPNNERWEYIFSTYFTYDDTEGSEGWDGSFPPLGSGEQLPDWRFYTDAGDTLGGLCSSFIVTIRDINGNGILEDNERANKDIAMTFVCYINFGGGCFNQLCGPGSASGGLDTAVGEWEEELYIPSATSASGRLYLTDSGCSTGVESKTWSGLKVIYKD
ncbi:MAG TPA: hypothetical protein VMX58_01635, partial [Patescibacteria group bacterium]|nr:hypothetical protein [Patescibacteria group bacterium]